MVRLDLTGKRYGILTVIGETEKTDKNRKWLCLCDCGNKTVVRQDRLRGGYTQSCGCIKPRNISKANLKDLTGKRFGKLIVVKRTEKETKLLTSFWLCKCDCGNTAVVSSNNLSSGHTKSCGCLMKPYHFERKRHVTKESCLEDMISIYKEHGIINQPKLNEKLPGYSLSTLRNRFGGMKADAIWEIVKKELELEEDKNENK